ncbi:hypothetical protein BGW80DRAFT_868233 [Lactifluus volemus]|nr:hypothetical protein BGW80DRAFT_868233 [Lactifluus volemus]
MVPWHDPAVLEKEYLAVVKLDHVVAGIYIWETILTADFELEVLRRKKPYRWTIWLYLGTRYTTLLTFIMYLVDSAIASDSRTKLPCQLLGAIYYALTYASWEFASLLIALRVIAIWDRNKFVSSLAIAIWLVGLSLNICGAVQLRGVYDPIVEKCITVDVHNYLANVVGMLVVDVVLLVSMVVGLLRYSHRSSTGLRHLLYRQCIMWLVLAVIGEAPLMVLLILNFNEAMNNAYLLVTVAIMSIGAARMYRSLFQHVFSTEYVSSKPPQVSPGAPAHREANSVARCIPHLVRP